MIDLHFFGRGAAFYPQLGNTNAYFTLERDLFFLDCGESTFEKAVRMLDLAAYDQIYVLLTHLHADHSGSLASLCSYTACVLQKQIWVIHPIDTITQLLTLQGISSDFYHYSPTLPKACPLAAEPIEVPHAADMRCFGWLMKHDRDTVYFSGDSNEFSPRIAKELRDGNISRVYHDVTIHPSQSHCQLCKLEESIVPEDRKKVWCMHLDSDCEQEIMSKGFRVVTCSEDSRQR